MIELLPHEKEALKRESRQGIFDIKDLAFILTAIANSKIAGTDLQQAVITVDRLQKKYKVFKVIDDQEKRDELRKKQREEVKSEKDKLKEKKVIKDKLKEKKVKKGAK